MIKCIVANKYILIDETIFIHFYNRYNDIADSGFRKRTRGENRFKNRFSQLYLNGIKQYNKYGITGYALTINTGTLKGKVLMPLIGDISYYENMNKLNKLFNSPINLLSLERHV